MNAQHKPTAVTPHCSTAPLVPHATVAVWPEGKMAGNGAEAAEVPRNDCFHRITNVSRPALTLGPFLRIAGGWEEM